MPRYRVQCVIRDTGQETSVTVTASNAERAMARAHAMGLVTGAITTLSEQNEQSGDGEGLPNGRKSALWALAFGAFVSLTAVAAILLAPRPQKAAGEEQAVAVTDRASYKDERPVSDSPAANLQASDADMSAPPRVVVEQAAPSVDIKPSAPPRLLDGPYLLIPIHGEIGTDCVASGVRRALREVEDAGVRTVVFDIDSPGGLAVSGIEMARSIDALRGKVMRVAMVHRATSAAAWPAVSCDVIVMEEASTIGATVVFSITDTGSAEVDAKMSAAFVSEMASIAAANGHNPDVVQAMGIKDKELYWWRAAESEPRQLSATRPNPTAFDVEILDTANTVLDLDAVKADAIGFGILRTNPLLVFGPNWKEEPRRLGGDRMREAVREEEEARASALAEKRRRIEEFKREKERLAAQAREGEERASKVRQNRGEIDRMVRFLSTFIEDAKRKDPSNYNDYYFSTKTGLLTPDSQISWTSRSDNAISAWETVQRGWEDIAKRMQKLSLDKDDPDLKAEVEAQYSDVRNRIAHLRESRVRYR